MFDKAEVIARTVISQQPFYLSDECNDNHRQLLETMIGAAIWYLPQGMDLWTGDISIDALNKLSLSQKISSLTKDHNYPRKVAAAELLKIDWKEIPVPAKEILNRYKSKYGLFNYVLPEENKRLVQFQKGNIFKSPKDSYEKAGILLRELSKEQLDLIRKGDFELAKLIISN